MNDDGVNRRVRDALEAIAVKPYPSAGVAHGIACRSRSARRRVRVRPPMVVATLIAAMAATALGAATASPYAGDLAERLRAVLAGHAIPVRRVTFVHERAVTTADAQRAVTFPIIVPSGLSVTSTMLLDDPSGGPRSVELAVRNAALTTVLLNESPASDRRSSAIERMAYITHRTQRGALGRPTRLTWRIGATRLTIVTDDAVSRSLAEHVRDITRSQPRRSRE